MSRLLLESGPPDAVALEDGSGVVLLEVTDDALERRDPQFVRIDRPNWRISWTAGFNINLHGEAAPEVPQIPAGRQLTELPPQPKPLQLNQRTWLWNYNPNLVAQDRMITGAELTDRPPVPPFYREWSQNLLQRTLHPLPPGIEFTERPPVPPWYRTWAVTLQQSTLALQPIPFAQLNWPLTPAPIRASNLGTWTAKYNENLVGQDARVVGQTITERPPVAPFYRAWSENLLERTLAPAPSTPRVAVVTELPPRGHPHPIALRTWINVGVPLETFPSFVTGWDIGQGVDWRRSWLVNLLESTLSTPPVALPPGKNITDRPPVPPWYRTWLLMLQQSTLAPAVQFPFNQNDWPLPRPYPYGRTWLQNLLQSTLTPPTPFSQTDWPLPRAYPFGPDLRTWAAFYNRHLIGQDARVAGQAITDRPGVPPWYRAWSENLLERTLAPAPPVPPVAIATELTPRGHQYPIALRSWINVGVPQELFPSFVTGWDIGDQPRDWRRSWLVNLQQSTLSVPPTIPPGVVVTERPSVPPYYRSLTVSIVHQVEFEKPFLQSGWPLTPAAIRAANLGTWTAQYNSNLIGKDALPFAQFVWPPGPAPIFMPNLRTLTARHNFDLVDVFPEPVPPGAAQIPGWWYEKWQEIAMRQGKRKRPVPDLPAFASETTPYEPSKTFKVSPRVIEALAQATTIDDIRALAREETGHTRNLLNQMIAEHKRRMKDEDDLEVILMVLS